MLELEDGEQGTGSLEGDEARLIVAGSEMNTTTRSCLVYRAAQKRISRQYLILARRTLQDTMRALTELVEAERNGS